MYVSEKIAYTADVSLEFKKIITFLSPKSTEKMSSLQSPFTISVCSCIP